MKRLIKILAAAILLAAASLTAHGQSWQEKIYLEYYVEPQGDTVYFDELPAAVVFPRIRKTKDPNVKKYYRLVYNFNKVYPYTSVARKLVNEADSTIAAEKMNRFKKDKYVTKIQNQILNDFTDVVRHMTISQGQLLCRLVDREIGKSSYQIVKDYKNGIAAGFWQGVAKTFKQDLKSHYDPKGEDRMTEYLIEKWEQGQFDALYYSVFLKWPEHIEVPLKYR